MLRSWLPRGPDGAAQRYAAERAGEASERQEIQELHLVDPFYQKALG